MAERGEDVELNDFDINDQYADDYEDTSFIDNVMDKNDDNVMNKNDDDDSFDTAVRQRLTKPPNPSLLKDEIKRQEKQDKEEKELQNNIKVITKLLENTDEENRLNARQELLYTKAGIRKLADYFEKLKLGDNLTYEDKNGVEHRITTDEKGKWRLKAFSTIKAEFSKEGKKVQLITNQRDVYIFISE